MRNCDRTATIYTATDRAAAVSSKKARVAGLLGVSAYLDREAAFATPWSIRPIWIKRRMVAPGRKREFFCYMLFRCNRMIYTGRSTNVRGRIGCHAHDKNPAKKDFDAMSYLALDTEASMIWWESVLIDVFRPDWNNKWGDVMIQRPVVEDAFATLLGEVEDGEYRNLLLGLAGKAGCVAA